MKWVKGFECCRRVTNLERHIGRIWNSFQNDGDEAHLHNGGRAGPTTWAHDRYFVLQTRCNRFQKVHFLKKPLPKCNRKDGFYINDKNLHNYINDQMPSHSFKYVYFGLVTMLDEIWIIGYQSSLLSSQDFASTLQILYVFKYGNGEMSELSVIVIWRFYHSVDMS